MRYAFSLIAVALAVAGPGCGPSDPVGRGEASVARSSGSTLDPSEVPENLRHLVPLASQWGIGDDIERLEFVERSSPAERAALAAALAPHHAEITAWLDSFGSGALSDEAAAFMYMQLALDEMP